MNPAGRSNLTNTLWQDACKLAFASAAAAGKSNRHQQLFANVDFNNTASVLLHLFRDVIDPEPYLSRAGRICLPDEFSVKMRSSNAALFLSLLEPYVFFAAPIRFQKAMMELLILIFKRSVYNTVRFQCGNVPFKGRNPPEAEQSRVADEYILFPALLNLLQYGLQKENTSGSVPALSVLKRIVYLLSIVGVAGCSVDDFRQYLCMLGAVSDKSMSLSLLQGLRIMMQGQSSIIAKALPRYFFNFGGRGAGLVTHPTTFPFSREYQICLWFRIENFENPNGVDANSDRSESAFNDNNKYVQHIISWQSATQKGIDIFIQNKVLTVAVGGANKNDPPNIVKLKDYPLRRGVWFHLSVKHSKPRLSLFSTDELSIFMDHQQVFCESIRFPAALASAGNDSSTGVQFSIGRNFDGQMTPIYLFSEALPAAAIEVIARLDVNKNIETAMSELGTNYYSELQLVDMLQTVPTSDRTVKGGISLAGKIAMSYHPARVTSGLALEVFSGRHAVMGRCTYPWTIRSGRDLLKSIGGLSCLLPLFPKLLVERESERSPSMHSTLLETRTSSRFQSSTQNVSNQNQSSGEPAFALEINRSHSISQMLANDTLGLAEIAIECADTCSRDAAYEECDLDKTVLNMLHVDREEFMGEGNISLLLDIFARCLSGNRRFQQEVLREGSIDMITYSLQYVSLDLLQIEGEKCVMALMALQKAAADNLLLEYKITRSLLCNFRLWYRASFQLSSSLMSVVLAAIRAQPRTYSKLLTVKYVLDSLEFFAAVDDIDGDYYSYEPTFAHENPTTLPSAGETIADTSTGAENQHICTETVELPHNSAADYIAVDQKNDENFNTGDSIVLSETFEAHNECDETVLKKEQRHRSLPPPLLSEIHLAAIVDEGDVGPRTMPALRLPRERVHRNSKAATLRGNLSRSSGVLKRYKSFRRAVNDTIEDDVDNILNDQITAIVPVEADLGEVETYGNSSLYFGHFTPEITPSGTPTVSPDRNFKIIHDGIEQNNGVSTLEQKDKIHGDELANRWKGDEDDSKSESYLLGENRKVEDEGVIDVRRQEARNEADIDDNSMNDHSDIMLSKEQRKHLRDCIEAMLVTLIHDSSTEDEIQPLLDFMTFCRDRIVLNEIATILLYMLVEGEQKFVVSLIAASKGPEEFASFVLLYLVHQPYEELRCTGIRIITHFYLRVDNLPPSATNVTLRRKKGFLSRAIGNISNAGSGQGLKRLQLCGGLALLCEIISSHCKASSELTYSALLELLMTKPGMKSQVTIQNSDIFSPTAGKRTSNTDLGTNSNGIGQNTLSPGPSSSYQQGSVGQRAVVFAAAYIRPDQVHDEGVDMMNSLVLPIFFELIPQLPINAHGQVYTDFLALLKHGTGNRDAFISSPSWHLCMFGLVSQLVSLTVECQRMGIHNTYSLLAQLEQWAGYSTQDSPFALSAEKCIRSRGKGHGELLRAWRGVDGSQSGGSVGANNETSSAASSAGRNNFTRQRMSSGNVSFHSLGSFSSEILSCSSGQQYDLHTSSQQVQEEQDLWFAIGMKIYATLLLHSIEFKGGWKEIDRSISYSYDSDLGYSVAQTILSHVLNDLTFNMRSRYKEIQRLAKSTAAHENVEAMDRLENFLCLLLTTSQLALVDQHCAVNAVKNFHLCKLRVQHFDEALRELSAAGTGIAATSSADKSGLPQHVQLSVVYRLTEERLASRLRLIDEDVGNLAPDTGCKDGEGSVIASSLNYDDDNLQHQVSDASSHHSSVRTATTAPSDHCGTASQQSHRDRLNSRISTTGDIDMEDQKNAHNSDFYEKYIDFYHVWQDIVPNQTQLSGCEQQHTNNDDLGSASDPNTRLATKKSPVHSSSGDKSGTPSSGVKPPRSMEDLLHPLERNHDVSHGKLVLVLQTLRFFDIIFWPVSSGPLRNVEMLRFHKENINGFEGDAAGVLTTGSYPMTIYSAVMRLCLFVMHRLSPITHFAILNLRRLRTLISSLDQVTLHKTPTYDWLLATVLHTTVSLQRISHMLEPIYEMIGITKPVQVPTLGPWSDDCDDSDVLLDDESARFEEIRSNELLTTRLEQYFNSSPARNLLRNVRSSLMLLATAFELHREKLSVAMEERSHRSLWVLVEHYKAFHLNSPSPGKTEAEILTDPSFAAAFEQDGDKFGETKMNEPFLRRQSNSRVSFSSDIADRSQQRSDTDTHSISLNSTAINTSAASTARRNPLSALIAATGGSSSAGPSFDMGTGHSPIKNVIDSTVPLPPRSPGRIASLARSASSGFRQRSASISSEHSDANEKRDSECDSRGRAGTEFFVSSPAATAGVSQRSFSQHNTTSLRRGLSMRSTSITAADIDALPESFELADILELLKWLRYPYLRLNPYRNVGFLKAIDALDFLEARAVNRFAKDADILMQGLENQRDLALKSIEEMTELKELSLSVYDLFSSRNSARCVAARTADALNQKKIAASWQHCLERFDADWSPWSTGVIGQQPGFSSHELALPHDRSMRRFLLRPLPEVVDHRDAAYLEGKLRDQELFEAAKLVKIKPNIDPNVAEIVVSTEGNEYSDGISSTGLDAAEKEVFQTFRGIRASFLNGSSSVNPSSRQQRSKGTVGDDEAVAAADDEDDNPDDSSGGVLANLMYGVAKRPQWTLMFNWSADERMLFTSEAMQVTLEHVIEGVLVLTNRCLYFHGKRRTGGLAVLQQPLFDQIWQLDHLTEIYGRRYLLQNSAVELFFAGSPAVFLAFRTTAVLGKFFRFLKRQSTPLLTTPKTLSPAVAFSHSPWTELWRRRLISNFEYLMHLNILAGRSFNDITQYPVFPWVIADFTSKELDLRNPHTFRRLDLPIGALNPARLMEFLDRYRCFDDDMVPKFMYGSHYSSAGVVLHYLVRQEPFTSLAINLQGGRFDCPDRIFFDIQRTWQGCNESMSDVKELIPEMYCCPEIFLNMHGLPLGRLQDGSTKVDDVVLPPWADNAWEFVRLNRMALESDYVSENLPAWIDLVFGCKQRGQAAVDAHNVFYYLTYENAIDIEAIEDPLQREAAKTQVTHFGQTPSQLLHKPHPQRFHREECSLPLCCELHALGSIRRFTPQRQQSAIHGPIIAISCGSERLVVCHADLTLAFYKWSSFPDDDRHPFTLRTDRTKTVPSSTLSTALPLIKGRELVLRQRFGQTIDLASEGFQTPVPQNQVEESDSARSNILRSFNRAISRATSTNNPVSSPPPALLPTQQSIPMNNFTGEGVEEDKVLKHRLRNCHIALRSGDVGSGRIFSSQYWDNSLKVHSIDSLRLISSSSQSHMGQITCLQQGTSAADAHVVITGGEDGACRVWIFDRPSVASVYTPTAYYAPGDADNELIMQQINTDNATTQQLIGGNSSSVGSRPASMVTGSIANANALQCVHILCGHSHAVRCISYSGDSGLLLSADETGVLCLHDVLHGKYLRTLTGMEGASVDVVYASSLGYLVGHAWSSKRTNLYWINGQLLLSTTFPERVECMTASSDGLVLICGGMDGKVMFREMWSLQEMYYLDLHSHGAIRCLSFTEDYQYLFAGSDDGTFSVITDPDARWRIFNAALQKTPLLGAGL